jgi:hypothetical protein
MSSIRDRIISSCRLPARSPDLNAFGFFFWGCLKGKVYNSNPLTEKELKENFLREMTKNSCRTASKGKSEPFRQCEECPLVEGQRFQHHL